MAARASPIYNALFKKNYSMLGFVFASAFVFEMTYDSGMNAVWDRINRGRQWKDIRHKYAAEAAEDDE